MGKEFIKPTSSLVKGIEPEDLSAYAEDHGLCPWTPSAIAYGVGR
jgi:hypothetical protein